jgi:hypothetical protein
MSRTLKITGSFLFNTFLALALSSPFTGCSKDDDKETTTTPTTSTAFADVAPIIKASCGVSGCHGKAGAISTVYEENEANVKAAKAKITERMNSTNTALVMPQSPGTISAADKTKLLDYIGKL